MFTTLRNHTNLAYLNLNSSYYLPLGVLWLTTVFKIDIFKALLYRMRLDTRRRMNCRIIIERERVWYKKEREIEWNKKERDSEKGEIEALSLLTLRFYPLAFIALTFSTPTALNTLKNILSFYSQ